MSRAYVVREGEADRYAEAPANTTLRRVSARDLEPGDFLPGSRTTILRPGVLVGVPSGRARWVVRRKSGTVEEVDWNARTRIGVIR